eukprot:529409_1
MSTLLFFALVALSVYKSNAAKHNVTYDSRSLIIDGEHILLLSGGMHYARGTPSTWDHVMKLAKEMNLNTIQTYFMWNIHEPLTKGDLVWSGRANITQFMELAQQNDLYVNLRIGPYVCGEWNYGGFPWWTRDIPGIQFRTYNQPFMNEMGRILQIAVDQIRPYLASNGGPIVMLQVENEYNYHPNQDMGMKYVEWAVSTAENTTKNDPVPWIMCEHNPNMNTSSAINTINGFWDEHNEKSTSWPSPLWIKDHVSKFPKQPLWWTEDQAWFQGWQGGTLIRPVNQIANGILRWYALGGTYHNFYMMYGGTNFGRTAGKNVITAYANDAPINPYGMANNPKYNKLSQIFGVLLKYSKCLLSQSPPKPVEIDNNKNLQAITYSNTSSISITFLSNIGPKLIRNVNYKNKNYDIAANSTIVLDINGNMLVNSTGQTLDKEQYPDCILPNTKPNKMIDISTNWKYWNETAGKGGDLNTTTSQLPIEMWNITSDTTEYIWYIPTKETLTINTSYTLQMPNSQGPQYVYVYDITNNILLSMGNINNKLQFNNNNNSLINSEYKIGILIASFGMSNGGYSQNTEYKGITGAVNLNGKNIANSEWISEGMLYGESLKIYNYDSFDKVTWK